MKIFLNVSGGKKFDIEIEELDTIGFLKGKISAVEGFPPAHQKIKNLDGATLENNKTLADYEIKPDEILDLEINYFDMPKILDDFYVNLGFEKKIRVKAVKNEEMLSVKEKIYYLTSFF
jgi:hypothetical protein